MRDMRLAKDVETLTKAWLPCQKLYCRLRNDRNSLEASHWAIRTTHSRGDSVSLSASCFIWHLCLCTVHFQYSEGYMVAGLCYDHILCHRRLQHSSRSNLLHVQPRDNQWCSLVG